METTEIDSTAQCGVQVVFQISLLTWNILAPMWINRQRYMDIGADMNLLHVDKRLFLVIDRLLEFNADVINLQEVQESQFKIIESDLKESYVCSGFSPHKDGYWTDEWLPIDTVPEKNGQATFYRKTMFEYVTKRDVQTTPEGNFALFTVLKLKSCSKHPSYLLVVNGHLESGRGDWRTKTRTEQAGVIHSEILKMEEEVMLHDEEAVFNVVFVGDFNTYGEQSGMREIRRLGFVDVAEMMDNLKPTHFGFRPGKSSQLDHITLLKTGLEAGTISVKHYEVPNLESSEFDKEAHEATIMKVIERRIKRKNISETEADHDPVFRDIISHIKPSSTDTKESNSARALRCGSDHLPVYAEIEIKH